MVQERPLTMRQQILAALSEGNMSSKEIADHLKCDVEKTKHMRPDLVKKGLIEEVGVRLNKDGKGTEKIWGLVQGGKKVKAVNAFDWRNWETQVHFSAREIAFSNSQFLNKKESRVIVYSRA